MTPILLTDAPLNTRQVFICSECGHVFVDQTAAEMCCTCRFCKKLIPFENYRRSAHNACQDEHDRKRTEEQFKKAEKVENYDSYLYDPSGTGQDGYWQDMESLCDFLFDNFSEEDIKVDPSVWPEFVFCCRPDQFGISLDDIIENALSDHYEDAYDALKGVDQLKAAVNAFNGMNQHVISYHPDYKRCVRVPTLQELLKENETRK